MSTTSSLPVSDDMRTFSPTACPSWFRRETLENPENITIIVTLGLVTAVVIVGNLLVVLAVFASAKLKTVTNFLIVSLAVSDLLVGLAVLPYSITLEVLDVWVFGEVWCSIWLAVDVWLCTASILNLCAISIDRFLAITKPVHYKSIMSPVRVKLLIASVWVLSFIICFPPLVGWNDRVKDDEHVTEYGNVTVFGNSGRDVINKAITSLESNFTRDGDGRNSDFIDIAVYSSANFTDAFGYGFNGTNSSDDTKYYVRSITSRCSKPQCALISNQGYVIYSALGSFYIPMLIMLFFYWKIYVAALKTSRALSRGFKTTKSSRVNTDSENLTLRIHRGRPISEKTQNQARSNANASGSSTPTTSNRRQGDILVPRRLPTVVYHHTKEYSSPRCFREGGGGTRSYYTTVATDGDEAGSSSKTENKLQRAKSTTFVERSGSSARDLIGDDKKMDHLTVSGEKNGKAGGNLFSRLSRRSVRWHAKRFKTEAKATKTVGIIVGGFILCWLPFFTVYLIFAFCPECIPELLFKVFFYLGYCNSALNPIIYGMVSKDFRFAFKKILCRCKLKDDGVSSLIRQIHMPTFFEEEDHCEETLTRSQTGSM